MVSVLSSYYEKFLATGEVKCIDEEIPFAIPSSWEWERWGNISQSIQYGYNAPALENGDIRMVRISDIQNNKVLWENVPFCLINTSEIETYLLKVNDILFARTGGTVGKSFLVEEVPMKAIYAGGHGGNIADSVCHSWAYPDPFYILLAHGEGVLWSEGAAF